MVTNINYSKVASKLYNLYITKKYPFIKMKEDGAYEWCYKFGDLENKDYQVLQLHLKRRQTIGVFCSDKVSKFICFDVDFKQDKTLARWYTFKLLNTLEDFGFKRDNIYVSLSGGKGYHVEIFFEEIVSCNQLKFLYDLVIEQMYYETDYELLEVKDNNFMTLDELKSKIELRPLNNIGVKLPLSIHQKTKVVCYYCDNYTLEPIKDITYVLKIKQIDRDYMDNAIKLGMDFRDNRNKINYFNKEIKEKVKPVKAQKMYTDENFTIEYIENLINNGLTIQGSRHNSLMKLARYYYHFNSSQKECEEFLVDWMSWQDAKYYNATKDECIQDIKEIVEYVYKNNKGLNGIVRDISINKDEMMEIMKFKERKKKLLYFALIIHCKRYSQTNGNFYMTYEQIEESCGVTNKTSQKYIDELVVDSEMEIVRRNKRQNNSFKHLPNMYKIINENIRINNNEGHLINKSIMDLDKEFNNTVVELFTKKEIKKLLPDKQYREMSRLYA